MELNESNENNESQDSFKLVEHTLIVATQNYRYELAKQGLISQDEPIEISVTSRTGLSILIHVLP